MNFLSDPTINVIIILGVIALAGVFVFYKTKNVEPDKKALAIKTELFKLFLYAEKQGWIGAEKFDFVVTTFMENYLQPGAIISAEQIGNFVQDVYNEFKDWLDESNIKESTADFNSYLEDKANEDVEDEDGFNAAVDTLMMPTEDDNKND